MNKAILAAVAAALVLGACTTVDTPPVTAAPKPDLMQSFRDHIETWPDTVDTVSEAAVLAAAWLILFYDSRDECDYATTFRHVTTLMAMRPYDYEDGLGLAMREFEHMFGYPPGYGLAAVAYFANYRPRGDC